MVRRVRKSSLIATFGLVLGASFVLVSPTTRAAAAFQCEDNSNLCLEPTDGANWEPDASSTIENRRKRSKANAGTISMTIEGGRGSLFVNGRYAGTAPLDSVEILAGKNDIQVRDGEYVLTKGLLTVPGGASVTVTVRHP
jgi:hypothetical protein